MQKDFHYSVIRILAEKAGFSPFESQLIAYSSQYVDDAVEHKPLILPENYSINSPRLDGRNFNPICTAHKGLQFLSDFKKDVQEKIYLSFHFIPPIYNGQKNYSYIVKPKNDLVISLIQKRLDELRESRTEENLIGLGIALHSFADSWSHSEFSGIYNPDDNDIEEIRIYEEGQLKKISPLRQFRNNLLPSLGHAEAFVYPDLPFLRWSFVKKNNPKKTIIRDNPNIFFEAAREIFYLLCNFNGCKTSFDSFSRRLWIGLNFISNDVDQRFDFYRELFPEINFFYNENLWKDQILNPPKFSDKSITAEKSYYWFYFHNKALEQRIFILQKIKRL